MNSYDVSRVVRHENGRCEVYFNLGSEEQCYGVVPGSGDRSPLHQELEQRLAAGDFASVTKEFVPALPGVAPSIALDDLKRMLTKQVEQDYAARTRGLFDPEFALLLEEARLWLTELADDEASDPNAEDYPLLSAMTGQGDLHDTAASVVKLSREGKARLAHLLKTKNTGIGLINSANTADDAEAHFAAIDWGA